jgi:hypothetical protein
MYPHVSIYVVTSITCGYIRQMMYPAEEGIQTVTTSIYVVTSITCGYIRQMMYPAEEGIQTHCDNVYLCLWILVKFWYPI